MCSRRRKSRACEIARALAQTRRPNRLSASQTRMPPATKPITRASPRGRHPTAADTSLFRRECDQGDLAARGQFEFFDFEGGCAATRRCREQTLQGCLRRGVELDRNKIGGRSNLNGAKLQGGRQLQRGDFKSNRQL